MTLTGHHHLPRTELPEPQAWVVLQRLPCDAVHASPRGTQGVRTFVRCEPLPQVSIRHPKNEEQM